MEPVRFKNVELLYIDTKNKIFDVLVIMKKEPHEMTTPETAEEIRDNVDLAVSYFIKEGFLPELSKQKEEAWFCAVAAVCYPPQKYDN